MKSHTRCRLRVAGREGVVRRRNRLSNQVASFAAIVRPVLESLEARKLLASVLWDGGGDGVNWTNGANWSNDAVPVSADDVTISVAANPSIIIGSGLQSIHSLQSDELLTVSGASTTLQV